MISIESFHIISLSFLVSFFLTYYIIPKIIKKMVMADICGIDVNKINKPKIPEMGGLAAVIGFSLGTTLTLGFVKYVNNINEVPTLISISVICIASLIGLLDDISILGRKEKAWFISIASLPIIISQEGQEKIMFFTILLDFSDYNLFFWLILVPLGVTGCANALNMSAGYNGLESGQMVIISFSLLVISFLDNSPSSILLLYSSITGSTLALFWFNKYPAKIFVGDIGTLGFGSLIAVLTVMSGHVIYGIICIMPTFYELFSTTKYSFRGVERREACMNPEISSSGIIKPTRGSEDYTLAFTILSRKDLNEKHLVYAILGLYLLSGFLAITLFCIFN